MMGYSQLTHVCHATQTATLVQRVPPNRVALASHAAFRTVNGITRSCRVWYHLRIWRVHLQYLLRVSAIRTTAHSGADHGGTCCGAGTGSNGWSTQDESQRHPRPGSKETTRWEGPKSQRYLSGIADIAINVL